MALGEILRNARLQKGLTPSDVAESTHLLIQVVEDLEREDFKRVAAPIYGRGFVKLYAELLELDPVPLIRDFMEIYEGSRAPVIRSKPKDANEEVPPPAAPVTRTVTGAAVSAALPQRQPVQPRPAVRPLSAPQPSAPAVQKDAAEHPRAPVSGLSDAAVLAAGEGAPQPALSPDEGAPSHAFVVEPEEAGGEVEDQPDLFRPKAIRRRTYSDLPPREGEKASGVSVSRKPKLPVFMVGGRLSAEQEHETHGETTHVFRNDRIRAFVDGIAKLKAGVESKLPDTLPRRQLLALGGAGLLLVVALAVGIGSLYKMTGSHATHAAGQVTEATQPPPDMYVD